MTFYNNGKLTTSSDVWLKRSTFLHRMRHGFSDEDDADEREQYM